MKSLTYHTAVLNTPQPKPPTQTTSAVNSPPQSKSWAYLISCISLLIGFVILLWLIPSGCEFEAFVPSGYRCESDANCLSGYVCKEHEGKKVCLPDTPKDDGASQTDAGEAQSGDASTHDEQISPEASELIAPEQPSDLASPVPDEQISPEASELIAPEQPSDLASPESIGEHQTD